MVKNLSTNGAVNAILPWRWSGTTSQGAITSPAKPAFYNTTAYTLRAFIPRALNASTIAGEQQVIYNQPGYGYVAWRDPFKIGAFGAITGLDYSAVNHWTARPTGINASGQVAGELVNQNTDDYGNRIGPGTFFGSQFPYEFAACRWSAAGQIVVLPKPTGYPYTRAVGINDGGIVAVNAYSYTASGDPFSSELFFNVEIAPTHLFYSDAAPTRAFTTDGTTVTPLVGFDAGNTAASGIDAAGRTLFGDTNNRTYIGKGGAVARLDFVNDEYNRNQTALVSTSLDLTKIAPDGTVYQVLTNANNATSTLITLTPVTPALHAPLLASYPEIGVTRGAINPVVTVTGAYFAPQSVVNLNGQARPTTYVSDTTLQVQFTTADVATPDANNPTRSLTVVNPRTTLPGRPVDGGTSNAVPFRVYEIPAIPDSITPGTITFGGDAVRYTIHGTGFIPGKTEVSCFYGTPNGVGTGFDGSDVQVISSTELQVTINTYTYLSYKADATFYVGPYNSPQAPDQPHPWSAGNKSVSAVTLDVVAPTLTVSGVNVNNVSAVGATVSCQTNLNVNSFLYYGTTPDPISNETVTSGKSHTTTLSGLTPGTLYYYKIVSYGPSNIVTTTGSFVTSKATGSPTITVSGVNLVRNGVTVTATVTLKNSGDGTATQVSLNGAALGSTATSLTLPQDLGSLAPGATLTVTMEFPGATPGTATLKVQGTYTGGAGGSFTLNRRVSVP